jgi:ADP-heptose:LPS heptosyltransferase
LLTTGLLRAIRQHWPSVQIDYLVAPGASAGLTNNPHLASLVEAPRDAPSYAAACLRLRSAGYQVAYILDRAPQWSLLALVAAIPIRAGLNSHHRGLGLTHPVRPWPGAHEANLAAAVIGTTGVPVIDLHEEYHPTEAGRRLAQAVVDELGPGKFVVIHPAGGVNAGMQLLAKRWPVDCFRELVVRLMAAGAHVALVGAAEDEPVCSAVRVGFASDQARIVDLAGRLNLDALAALAQRAGLYVGHDSGPTHLAAAVGAPTVAIFGPTDPQVYAPLGKHVHVVGGTATGIVQGDLRSQAIDPTAIQRVSVNAVWQACLTAAPWLRDTLAPDERST